MRFMHAAASPNREPVTVAYVMLAYEVRIKWYGIKSHLQNSAAQVPPTKLLRWMNCPFFALQLFFAFCKHSVCWLAGAIIECIII